MLPGFRFLVAAIALSLSILVFGLGAAALLRAAHEQFASIPARRAPPEPVFAQPSEPAVPTLALLRVDPAAAAKAPIDLPTTSEPAAAVPDATPPAEPEKLAALKPDEAAPAEVAKPDAPAAESTPAATQLTAAEATESELVAPAASDATKVAAISDPAPPATEATPIAIEQTNQQASPQASPAATTIATLGGPEVPIAQPAAAKTTDTKADKAATKKRARAQHHKEQRRAARARLTSQAIVQQSADPFATPTITRATR